MFDGGLDLQQSFDALALREPGASDCSLLRGETEGGQTACTRLCSSVNV